MFAEFFEAHPDLLTPLYWGVFLMVFSTRLVVFGAVVSLLFRSSMMFYRFIQASAGCFAVGLLIALIP